MGIMMKTAYFEFWQFLAGFSNGEKHNATTLGNKDTLYQCEESCSLRSLRSSTGVFHPVALSS